MEWFSKFTDGGGMYRMYSVSVYILVIQQFVVEVMDSYQVDFLSGSSIFFISLSDVDWEL